MAKRVVRGCVGGVVCLCVWWGSPCAWSQAQERGASEPSAGEVFRKGVSLFQRGLYRKAEVWLNRALRQRPTDESVRYYLARTYLRLGLESQRRRDFETQRDYFQRALEVDPRLLEDSGFVKEYRKLQVGGARLLQIQRTRTVRRSPKARLVSFGVGLTLGVEGLLGLQTGVLIAGIVNPLITFSPVQQSFDFSLKVIPLQRFDWSPYLSAGVTLPLNNNPIHPFPQFRTPFLHFALGVQYISALGFTFSSGLSLSYHFDQPMEVSFIPVPSVQISWYF